MTAVLVERLRSGGGLSRLWPQRSEVLFIYKTLAHPELTGNYIQPFTLDERLAMPGRLKNNWVQRCRGPLMQWTTD